MSERSTFQEGEEVVLFREGKKPIFATLRQEKTLLEGFGVVDLSRVIGQQGQAKITVGGERYSVVRPAMVDLVRSARRPTQIVTPKDAQYLVYLGGVTSGSRVVEAGTGSGLLTLFLANTVGPEGHVYSYDRRAEHQRAGEALLRRSGTSGRVTFLEGDVAEGIRQQEVDSVILDVPEPWSATLHSWNALHEGGFLATYTPTYNQLERSVREMRAVGFVDVRALELLERDLHVGEGGTRPAFEMLGHTGFLAAGRKISREP
jgi:tRNA (adenine57-N1/adenine58-N1)-methyltransferase